MYAGDANLHQVPCFLADIPLLKLLPFVILAYIAEDWATLIGTEACLPKVAQQNCAPALNQLLAVSYLHQTLYVSMLKLANLVCRCEDVTKWHVRLHACKLSLCEALCSQTSTT